MDNHHYVLQIFRPKENLWTWISFHHDLNEAKAAYDLEVQENPEYQAGYRIIKKEIVETVVLHKL